MPQSQEKLEAAVEKLEFLPYFPTDLERAKTGFEKFNKVFETSGVLKKAAKKDKFFKDKVLFSALGLMPETGFYSGGGFQELDTEEERKELKRIYEEELGLKTLHWQRFAEGEKHDTSLFNPTSVERVIQKCPIPDLFPEEAKANPMEWVLSNPLEWTEYGEGSIKIARFGILSGFPPRASSVYREYINVQSAFIDKDFTERERRAYYKYANSPRGNRQFPKNLEKKLNEAVESKKISDFQAQLIKNFFGYSGTLELFGDGFFEEDEKYFDNIRKIFDELNISYL